jgi:hypothetical protein
VGWTALQNVILGARGSSARYQSNPIPHMILHSRYCDFRGLALPVELAGNDIVLPVGAELRPSAAARDFESLKQEPQLAKAFVGALRSYIDATAGTGAQWVIGRSSGGINPGELGLPNSTESPNEAVAVIFALVAHDAGKLLDAHRNRFVVVADLGGGFLDLCVADNLVLDEAGRQADIVSYGGYPLGVDRIDSRFSTTRITRGVTRLADVIGLAIRYHVWDYRRRSKANANRNGVVILTGGGFQRAVIQPRDLGLNDDRLAVEKVEYDTKYLTLKGLQTMMVNRALDGRGHIGQDITRESPRTFGYDLLDHFGKRADWAAGVLGAVKAETTWYAVMDSLRRAAVSPGF